MSTYAIGDVQGCYSALQRLVEEVQFNPAEDRLWFVGDLVNRGPHSLTTLRFIKALGPSAQVVLGNHDLFLLAVAEHIIPLRNKDTVQDILAADDREELLGWLRLQPLHHHDGNHFMVHAGLLPQWTIEEAARLAQEAEAALREMDYAKVLQALYPSSHLQWSPSLSGPMRWATIIKVLTRMRVCTPTGIMESSFSGSPAQAPSGYVPWFQIPERRHRGTTIVCGHWAALGLHIGDGVLSIDSGCVWGRQLTAVRLDDRQIFQVSCDGVGSFGD